MDGSGITGSLFHYSFLIALFASTLLVFIYLWKKGKLDMDEEPKLQMLEHEDIYGDDKIASNDAKVPTFLIFTYISLPIWGIVWFILFWNGSWGWFDRGYWFQLEKAANTTFPLQNQWSQELPEKTPEQI